MATYNNLGSLTVTNVITGINTTVAVNGYTFKSGDLVPDVINKGKLIPS